MSELYKAHQAAFAVAPAAGANAPPSDADGDGWMVNDATFKVDEKYLSTGEYHRQHCRGCKAVQIKTQKRAGGGKWPAPNTLSTGGGFTCTA